MFGVPFECSEPLSPADFQRCFTAMNEGTKALEQRGSKLVRLHYSRGTLTLIPDSGPTLTYLLRRGCPGCPD